MQKTETTTTDQKTEDEVTREILMDAQERLEAFFFGPAPIYADMAAKAKIAFPDREQQMIVLLAIFTSMDQTRRQQSRERFLSEILAPRAGEREH